MKILFVGDILGRAGRRAVQQNLSKVQAEHGIDLTIVNVENAAGGFGVSSAIAEAILKMGADVLTSGNHIWDQKEVYPHLDRQPRLLRPQRRRFLPRCRLLPWPRHEQRHRSGMNWRTLARFYC